MRLGQKTKREQNSKLRLNGVLVGCMALCSCSMMNPYDRPPPVALRPPDGLRLAGYANEGLSVAEGMRQTYYRSLQSTAIVRSSAGIAAGVLSGWAIYDAMKPDAGGYTDGDKRRAVGLAVSLATLYGFRELFVNPKHEASYVEGYKSLTCLMLQSAPLLMTERDPTVGSAYFANGAQATSQSMTSGPADASLRQGGQQAKSGQNQQPYLDARKTPEDAVEGDLDKLRRNLDTLRAKIDDVEKQYAHERATADALAGGNKDIEKAQTAIREEFKRTERALSFARNTLYDGGMLVSAVITAGRNIQDRVEQIAGAINQRIQADQNNLTPAKDDLDRARAITNSVRDIGVKTDTDQKSVSAAPPPGWMDRTWQILLAGPMSAVGGLLHEPSVKTTDGSGHALVLAAASPQEVASASAAAASAPSSKASAPKKPAVAASKKPAASAPVVSALTMDELKGVRDAVDAALKQAAAREDADKKKADLKVLEDKEKAIEKQSENFIAKAWPKGLQAQVGLAEAAEGLYAARRPVLQTLLNFRERTKDAANMAGCVELAPLRVTPDEVVKARAGDTISYLISQRQSGNPVAVLHGPLEGKAGAPLRLEPAGGPNMVKAIVPLGEDMDDQVLRLIVTDSTGVSSQTLQIVVKAKAKAKAKTDDAAKKDDTAKKPDAAASAPKAAASGT